MTGEGDRPKPPRPRPRAHSVPELAREVAELRDEVAEITQSHDVPRPTSTPPALRLLQKRWWNLTLRMLGAAALAFAGAAGGWLWRDCQAQWQRARPATIDATP
jgi:hypothetical protein